jgi:hypothetical protein
MRPWGQRRRARRRGEPGALPGTSRSRGSIRWRPRWRSIRKTDARWPHAAAPDAPRRYGAGAISSLTTRRLRRKYGEQLPPALGADIHRLGLSHARHEEALRREDGSPAVPGGRKRRDRRGVRRELSLTEDKLPGGSRGRAVSPRAAPGAASRRSPSASRRRARVRGATPLVESGEHRLRVKDPITGEDVEAVFR